MQVNDELNSLCMLYKDERKKELTPEERRQEAEVRTAELLQLGVRNS